MKLQFFHIGDLCRFMEILIEKRPEKHIFNTGAPNAVSIRDWVRICYETIGKEPSFTEVNGKTPQRSYFPFYDYEYLLDVTAMCSIMPDVTPLEQVFCGSYEWFRSNRELIVRKPLHEFISENFQ
jgi:nucleoside-diphosphate-sugar epimerase